MGHHKTLDSPILLDHSHAIPRYDAHQTLCGVLNEYPLEGKLLLQVVTIACLLPKQVPIIQALLADEL